MPEFVFLDQTAPREFEGGEDDRPAIIYEVQTREVAAGEQVTIRTRQRGEYWRVSVLREINQTGDVRALVNQGEVSIFDNALVLGHGGYALMPASSASVTVRNLSAVAIIVTAITVAGAQDAVDAGV